MSLTYNGTELQSITIDGTEVQIITMDGVEVWSAEPNPIPGGGSVNVYGNTSNSQSEQHIGRLYTIGYGVGASGTLLANCVVMGGSSGTAQISVFFGPFGIRSRYTPQNSNQQYYQFDYPGGSYVLNMADTDQSRSVTISWDFNNDRLIIGQYASSTIFLDIPFTSKYRKEWQNAQCFWALESRTGDTNIKMGYDGYVIRTS